MTCPSAFCSFLNFSSTKFPFLPIPSPGIRLSNNPFLKIKTPPRNYRLFISLNSSSDSTVGNVENNPLTEPSSKSDEDTIVLDEEDKKALGKVGSRVRVKVGLKVYHVPKVGEIELTGKTGILKQYVAIHKGKRISANLPYKVEFADESVQGRSGPLKFSAHLKEDEFVYID